MKFIHCADLHLDSKIETLPAEKSKIRREEVLRAFERLCDYATKNCVTAVIIAGDMFDTKRVTVKTRARVLSAITSNPDVDFLYLSGNHDEDNFITDLDVLPNNFKVFEDKWTAFRYGNTVISGVKFTPYNIKSVYETLSLSEKDVNIVVMHGQIAGYKGEQDAEIISLPKLKEKNVDYLALGHIHEYSDGVLDLRGKYAYSGCLEGRGFDELGDKGFVLLNEVDGEIDYEFIKFSTRQNVVFEYSVLDKPDWIYAKNEIINTLKKNVSTNSLVKVIIKGERKTDFDVDKDGLSQRLNEEFFFAKVYDKTEIKVEKTDYENDKSVRGEFVRAVWESDLSAEKKSKILSCGLNALKGEEF